MENGAEYHRGGPMFPGGQPHAGGGEGMVQQHGGMEALPLPLLADGVGPHGGGPAGGGDIGRGRVHSYNAEELRMLLGSGQGAMDMHGMGVPPGHPHAMGMPPSSTPQGVNGHNSEHAAVAAAQAAAAAVAISQRQQQVGAPAPLALSGDSAHGPMDAHAHVPRQMAGPPIDELGLQFLPLVGGPPLGGVGGMAHAQASHPPPQYDAALGAIAATADGFLASSPVRPAGPTADANAVNAAGAQMGAGAGGVVAGGAGGVGAAKPGGKARKPKPPSHARSEKARRDRINDNIETLKDLVPIQGNNDKASVLEQTAEYIKGLQAKMAELEAKCSAMGLSPGEPVSGGGENSAGTNSGGIAGTGAGAAGVSVSPAATASLSGGSAGDLAALRERSPSEDALAPARAVPSPQVSGSAEPVVTIDEGSSPETLFIKVVCPDRRGVLHAILNVMKRLSLDVTRAVIATPACGNIDDTFEVVQTQPVPQERIREQVTAALSALIDGSYQESEYEVVMAQLGKRTKPEPVRSADDAAATADDAAAAAAPVDRTSVDAPPPAAAALTPSSSTAPIAAAPPAASPRPDVPAEAEAVVKMETAEEEEAKEPAGAEPASEASGQPDGATA